MVFFLTGGLIYLHFFAVVFSTGFVASSDKGEVPSSLIRSYVTVERPSGGKQVKKSRQPSLSGTYISYSCLSPPLFSRIPFLRCN